MMKIKHPVSIWEQSSAINICDSGADWPNVQEKHISRRLEWFLSSIIDKRKCFLIRAEMISPLIR